MAKKRYFFIETDDAKNAIRVSFCDRFYELNELDMSMLHDGVELLDPTEDNEGPDNAHTRRLKLIEMLLGVRS